MDTLRDDGARKVLRGVTTVEEVLAATQEDVIVDVAEVSPMAVFEYRGVVAAPARRSRACATPTTPRPCAPCCASDGILLTVATEEQGRQAPRRSATSTSSRSFAASTQRTSRS